MTSDGFRPGGGQTPKDAVASAEGIGAEKREILWRLMDAQQAAIRFADAKAGAAAGLALAFTGWTISALGQSRRPMADSHLGAALLAGLVLLAACLLVTLAATLMTILPRRGRPALSPHPLHFGELDFASGESYARLLAGTDTDRLGEALAMDVWRVARIAGRKFRWVDRTLWGTAGTTLSCLVVLVLLGWAAHREASPGSVAAIGSVEGGRDPATPAGPLAR